MHGNRRNRCRIVDTKQRLVELPAEQAIVRADPDAAGAVLK
jgi:hypothetical protein